MRRRSYYVRLRSPTSRSPRDGLRRRASWRSSGRSGRTMSPVAIEGRKIARTFWGKAWCDNLERYSDFANRLPRGRTYVRNGSVVDLQIGPAGHGAGQRLGAVRRAGDGRTGAASPLERHLQGLRGRHRLARRAAAGTLLEGRHGAPLCAEDRPLSVAEGDSLRVQLPGLGVDVQARRGRAVRHRRAAGSTAGAALHAAQGRSTGLDCDGGIRFLDEGQATSRHKVLASDDLSAMFGIEMAPATPAKRPASAVPREAIARGHCGRVVQTDGAYPAGEVEEDCADKSGGAGQRLTPKKRQAISERMRTYWAERRADSRRRKTSESP